MIPRIIVVLLIVLAGVATIILPKTNLESPLLKKPKVQAQSTKNSIAIYPVANNNFTPAPQISAHAAVIIDVKTGVNLFEKNPNLKLLPASTTKLMTALVTLEKCSPQDVVTVTTVQTTGNQMGLEVGNQITVENLIYGLLIQSGNDAAYALASNCAKIVSDFVSSMNEKAKSLQMLNSHFANPAGFDDQFQYSTAADLAKLAKVAVTNPLISRNVSS